eukprot:CAMPEP_0194219812 /NCGR_PEP_ID=MMETSP0156-20130528/26927_1 /TAXON_ID=33649 /ORGANISM="Thalassionema nitzschioides, Strain L26-B" /LENGTH=370 /DNA_ID=CAMNT_0038949615 /DNA_START=87 /DNA_END=1199 /DNA_ORIENTATION=+
MIIHRQQSASTSPASMISDLVKDFRWKAAQMLTSNLSNTERTKLLDALDATEKSTIEKEQTTTIGEAVAAARMEEAQKIQTKWSKEKEQLLQEAEEAAQARVENEVQLVIQQREQQQQLSGDEHHTLLGPVVANLGYKKIYQVSAQILMTIPVWQKQRLYRHDRAKVILKDKLKTTHLGLPGIIVLHEDADGKLSILDGQHRVGALSLLLEKDPTAFDLENILVEVYSSRSVEVDISEDVFSEINKSEPIKLIDMPGVASAKERQILTDAAAKLKGIYPDMFKPSQQCRAPHLNIDNLRDSLHAAEILKKHSLKSTKALVEWIETQNQLLKEKYNSTENTDLVSKVKPKALEKAKEYDFYLGLDSSWLYN